MIVCAYFFIAVFLHFSRPLQNPIHAFANLGKSNSVHWSLAPVISRISGIVAGNFGEVSEDTHALVAALATCRVRVAGVTRGKKGIMRTEEGERSLAISGLRRRLGVLTVKCQAHSLLGRLEVLGPGAAAAAGRRWQAAELERCWRKEERAHSLATAQGWRSYRTGFGKLD